MIKFNENLKLHVIVQARMGSTRLPGKSLRKVGNHYLIDHVLMRLKRVFPESLVTLATTEEHQDDILVSHVCKNYGFNIYRGSTIDVQSRFIEIGREKKSKYLARITADDPFKVPSQIHELLNLLLDSNSDYVNNFSKSIYPIGMDIEVFTFESLIDSREYFDTELNREHVTTALRSELKYKRKTLDHLPTFNDIRLTIDTQDDLEFCSKVAFELEKVTDPFSLESLNHVLGKLKNSK